MPDADTAKEQAARAALALVQGGMVLGLGTGSTAAHFVRFLGERVRDGLRVQGVATSLQTEHLALAEGIDLIAPDMASHIDLAVDGADEVDAAKRLIKGGGGALLREKIVAAAASQFVVIVDAGKVVAQLGAFKLPVEVTPFAVGLTQARLRRVFENLGLGHTVVSLRSAAHHAPFVTDGGNVILDCACGAIPDAEALAHALDATPGVVEHGLFLGMADAVIVGARDGTVHQY